MEESTHPEFARDAAEKMPPKNLKMRSEAVFFERAQPT
jgi:hypothetical protein